MKETLISLVQSQLANYQDADAEELGEAVDMIKDLSETIYYCTITKAMEEKDKDEYKKEVHYYTPTVPYYERDMDRDNGRMYYTPMSGNNGTPNYYDQREYPLEFRDMREGRSPRSRKMYMESKQTHKDKSVKMRDLEKYVKELSEDLVEMIEGASPEEKQLLENKISALAHKISNV